jgi:hypothetical protein
VGALEVDDEVALRSMMEQALAVGAFGGADNRLSLLPGLLTGTTAIGYQAPLERLMPEAAYML